MFALCTVLCLCYIEIDKTLLIPWKGSSGKFVKDTEH